MTDTNIAQHTRFFAQSTNNYSDRKNDADPVPYGLKFKEKMFDGSQDGSDMSMSTSQSPTMLPQNSDSCIDIDTDF